MSEFIDKKKLLDWMNESIKGLQDCIDLGKINDYDDQHSLGCKQMQEIIIRMINEGKFDPDCKNCKLFLKYPKEEIMNCPSCNHLILRNGISCHNCSLIIEKCDENEDSKTTKKDFCV